MLLSLEMTYISQENTKADFMCCLFIPHYHQLTNTKFSYLHPKARGKLSFPRTSPKLVLRSMISLPSSTLEKVLSIASDFWTNRLQLINCCMITSMKCRWWRKSGFLQQAQSKIAARLHYDALTLTRQRKGRAGRVKAGNCYYMFTRKRYSEFAVCEEPELLRMPLNQLCLQIKSITRGKIQQFLSSSLFRFNLWWTQLS